MFLQQKESVNKIPEETIKEIVTTGVELQKTQLLTDKEESIKIMKIVLINL